MAIWFDPKGKSYAGDHTSSWLRAYVEQKLEENEQQCEARLTAEEQERKATDAQLQTNLQTETENREKADAAVRRELQSAITAEAEDREQVDVELTLAIATEKSAREVADAELQSGLEQEAQEREAEASKLNTALNTEKATREAADEELQTDLEAETAARISEDSKLREFVNQKADGADVLSKTNIAEYTPLENYHPATKKYVDDMVSAVEGGDVLVELANKPGKSLAGQEVNPTSSTTETAGVGAEIFNDYRERTYGGNDGTVPAQGNIASGEYSHAEGRQTTASRNAAHAEGYNTTAQGMYSHAEGSGTVAKGSYAHAEGSSTEAGSYAHAEGRFTKAIGQYSHAEGDQTEATGSRSHAEGGYSKASGNSAHAEGVQTVASGAYSHAEGESAEAKGQFSHAGGYCTVANDYQTAIGRYNAESAGPAGEADTTGTLFIVGNGTGYEENRSNAFRVDTNGAVYGVGAYNTTGADYAEQFEWQDGNAENEDRRGLFVTLDGEKIRIATGEDDDILGVISAVPSVVGDAQEDYWRGKYLTDVFGAPLTETVSVAEYTNERTEEMIPAHEETRYILNPMYDPEEKYVSRDKRPEWAKVGMLGKLVVKDDGTCEVNGYCKPSAGGIATGAESGYRVMKRIDENHVKILFR